MSVALSLASIVLILIIVLLSRRASRNVEQHNQPLAKAPLPAKKPRDIYKEHESWLFERWDEAYRQLDIGELKTFPKWFFDEASEIQMRLLAEKGLDHLVIPLTKGQASDVIGLFLPVENEDAELLKFFSISVEGLNQTTARATAAIVLADPAREIKWDQHVAKDSS